VLPRNLHTCHTLYFVHFHTSRRENQRRYRVGLHSNEERQVDMLYQFETKEIGEIEIMVDEDFRFDGNMKSN